MCNKSMIFYYSDLDLLFHQPVSLNILLQLVSITCSLFLIPQTKVLLILSCLTNMLLYFQKSVTVGFLLLFTTISIQEIGCKLSLANHDVHNK